jgi:hypothetical protein
MTFAAGAVRLCVAGCVSALSARSSFVWLAAAATRVIPFHASSVLVLAGADAHHRRALHGGALAVRACVCWCVTVYAQLVDLWLIVITPWQTSWYRRPAAGAALVSSTDASKPVVADSAAGGVDDAKSRIVTPPNTALEAFDINCW